MSRLGTASRTVEWTQRNIGAGVPKVNKWDKLAGFGPGTAWCGIFLGAALRAQGLTPPSGYAAAANWAGYGSAVSMADIQPGDIIDYGSTHVAMYIGGGKQIQGNNSNGTVGISGIGDSLGLGPITAIRRPPYKGGLGTKAEVEALAKKEGGGTGIPISEQASKVEGELEAHGIGGVAEEVIDGLTSLLGDKAIPILLNVGLVGGGAFLALFGIARMVGVGHPVEVAKKAAAAGAVA